MAEARCQSALQICTHVFLTSYHASCLPCSHSATSQSHGHACVSQSIQREQDPRRHSDRGNTHHCKSCATLNNPCKMAMRENGLRGGGEPLFIKLAFSAEINGIGGR